MSLRQVLASLVWLVSAAAAFLSVPAAGQQLYQGKTITLIVGVDAGSGYDAYGRLVARHMGKHIPGKPSFVVQNMPGAASIKASEYMALIAPKDGSTIAIGFPNALFDPLTAEAGKYRYDPTRFDYIGTADVGTRLCYTYETSQTRTFADARARRTVMGSTAIASPAWDYPHLFNAVAGARFGVVTGYKGPGDLFLAMERGEIEGMCGIDVSTVRALRPAWLGSVKANFLLQAGNEPNAEMTRLGIPSVWQFVAEKDRAIVELVFAQQEFQRPFFAPPQTSPPHLQVLRSAFMAALEDPELRAEAAKSQLEISPRSGEAVAAVIARLYATEKGVIERMTKAIRP